jgi:hypothetical protein
LPPGEAVNEIDACAIAPQLRPEQVAQDREQPLGHVGARLERVELTIARTSVSFTRSSARPTFPLSEIANAPQQRHRSQYDLGYVSMLADFWRHVCRLVRPCGLPSDTVTPSATNVCQDHIAVVPPIIL